MYGRDKDEVLGKLAQKHIACIKILKALEKYGSFFIETTD